MNTRLTASVLAALGGATALLMPGTSLAANVGYYGGCFTTAAAQAPLITQAGHTPVAVADLSAASLSSLGTLVLQNCNGSSLASQMNAAVSTAVGNGMTLVVYDWNPNGATASQLPGVPATSFTYAPGNQIDLAAGSPIATGPGGTLTNASLDYGGSSNHGFATNIPAGAIPLLTTAAPSQVVGFSYGYGAGRVVYSAIPLDCNLAGQGCDLYTPTGPATRAYYVNVLAWGSGLGGPVTTCASEGYTGTKLEWCKNICERGLTGATLDIWIHRWINRYRDLPYCAREKEEGPPQEQPPT